MSKNILLTGGSGFIGKKLSNLLISQGYSVSILTRTERKASENITYYKWNIENNYIDEVSVLKADYIIHLAGEGIAEKKWSNKRKKEIIDSRDKPINLIYSVLKKNNKSLDAFISASAVGIYGAFTSENICTEESPAANDFLGETCQKWETATECIKLLGIRTVIIRTGLVLGKGDGFLKKLVPLFKYRLGSIIGTGKQYMPWIHIDDLCNIYLLAITNTNMNGPYNAAVADDTNNAIFSKALANIYGYSIWLPKVPSFVIKLVMGEMSKIVLTGQRVSAQKIKNAGFKFKYSNLKPALISCLK
ncbi:TIGR01777 family oxidoreductase [Flavobacterium sp. F-65]|uniref:TIGR01777 family oxidoreductase n=1 Tax=Flavobacterium pisciphilum TaxID=2893755 RepID=A0ABS8MRU9_9FLAO|nr:TIGR01777 family oxidoreductase [Flavobacterium sp. F-65]MCC9071480.1 TIGR01777 family oxidoreductase [Flavobacterium sp. F-65]